MRKLNAECSGWCVEEDAEKCGDLLTLVGYVFVTLIAKNEFWLESFVVFDAYGYGWKGKRGFGLWFEAI